MWPLERPRLSLSPSLNIAETNLGKINALSAWDAQCDFSAGMPASRLRLTKDEALYLHSWCLMLSSGAHTAVGLGKLAQVANGADVQLAAGAISDVAYLLAQKNSGTGATSDAAAWLAQQKFPRAVRVLIADAMAANYVYMQDYPAALLAMAHATSLDAAPSEQVSCERAANRAIVLGREGQKPEAVRLLRALAPRAIGMRLQCSRRVFALHCQMAVEELANAGAPVWSDDVINACNLYIRSLDDAARVSIMAANVSWPEGERRKDVLEWMKVVSLTSRGLQLETAVEVAMAALENAMRVVGCDKSKNPEIDRFTTMVGSFVRSAEHRHRVDRLLKLTPNTCAELNVGASL